MPIEDIKSGDLVYSYNEETGEVGLKRVVQTFESETNELIHVKVDGQTIDTTNEHPFYVPKKGWIAATNLRAGDKLLLKNGKVVIVEIVQHELLEKPVKVYNFEVADWHTYYVSSSNVLVHNTCNLADAKSTNHILNGDKTGGGHMWPGKPGKSVFPKLWKEDEIMHSISDIATDPNIPWNMGRIVNGVQRYTAIGIRNGQRIKVIVDPSRIVTAFPY